MHRYAYLAKDYALANSGEHTIDIKIQDPITALWLEMRCDNGASYNHDYTMHPMIDAVELIDGSTVLWSLDGPQMLGLVCAQLGFMPNQKIAEISNDPQTLALPLLFGNFLGDVERSFDPTRFLAPQFRVRWNLANETTVGTQGFADQGLTITLIAEIMEDAPKPRSMLMAKEVYTYTSAVGTEYVPMRRDYPYKGIMIRPVASTQHWWEVITNLKLDLDGGAKVPFDIGAEDLQYQLFLRQPPLHYRHLFHKKDQDTLKCILKELEGVALISESYYDVTFMYNNYEYGERLLYVWEAGSAMGTESNIGANIRGYFPFHCVYIPFGEPLRPETWFNAPAWASIQLELLGGVADKAVSVCLLQDRPY